MKVPVPVIFTSAGNYGFQAVFNALKGSVYQCNPVDSRSDAYGLYLTEKGEVVPSRASQDFIPAILQIAKERRAGFIFPLSTEDQLFFAENLARFSSQGIKLIVSDLDAVRTSNDKLALVEFANQNQIPQPRFIKVTTKDQFEPALDALQASDKPIILKIALSTGAQGVKIIHPEMDIRQRLFSRDNIHIPLEDLRRWLDLLTEWPVFILTEYLPGNEYSVDLFLADGRVQAGVVRKRFQSLYGLALVAEVVNETDVMELATEVSEKLGLNYVVNVQVRRDDNGSPKLMEINPRIPGSIDLTVAAGCNMPLWALHTASGKKVRYTKPRIGLKMMRHWTAAFSTEWIRI